MRKGLWVVAVTVALQCSAAWGAAFSPMVRPTDRFPWMQGARTTPSTPDIPPVLPPPAAGATLPQTYDLSAFDLTVGTLRYIAPAGTGNDANGCTAGLPCLSIARALAVGSNGDAIIARGGLYRDNNLGSGNGFNKQMKIRSYPGETAEFRGSIDVTASTWTTEAGAGEGGVSLKWVAYTEQPITSGFGDFGNGQSITGGGGGVGRFPDLAWIGSCTAGPYQSRCGRLTQVLHKNLVSNGEFWVDGTFQLAGTASATNNSTTLTGSSTFFTSDLNVGDSITISGQTRTIATIPSATSLTVTVAFSPAISAQKVQRNGLHRLYITSSDQAQSNIEVSDEDNFLSINTTDVELYGIRVTRYSPSGSDFGAVDVNAQVASTTGFGDRFRCDNVSFEDIGYTSVFMNGVTADKVEDADFYYCSILRGGVIGISGQLWDDSTITGVNVYQMDYDKEFTTNIGSAAIKVTRCKNLTVEASELRDGDAQGLWFDQSCRHIIVGSNQITGNRTGVFFELSSDLWLVNNIMTAVDSNALKFGGGSNGLYAINNTMIGGPGVVGVYTDKRSSLSPLCADPSVSASAGSTCGNLGTLTSDRRSPYDDDRVNWAPGINAFYNNIVAYPTATDGLCQAFGTLICITDNNSGTSLASTLILHQPFTTVMGFPVPQTYIDYNIWQGGSFIAGLPNTTNNNTLTYASVGALSSALSGPPYNLTGGQENNSLATPGLVNPDGTPTPALAALHNTAKPIPTDAIINQYLAPGFQHFGVGYQ